MLSLSLGTRRLALPHTTLNTYGRIMRSLLCHVYRSLRVFVASFRRGEWLEHCIWLFTHLVATGDDQAAGTRIAGTGGDLDVFFILVSGYLARVLTSRLAANCADVFKSIRT